MSLAVSSGPPRWGVLRLLDQLGAGSRQLRVGAEGLVRVVDSVLRSEDRQQRDEALSHALVERRLLVVVVLGAGRLIVGFVVHPPQVVDELVGNVEARERR
jgi:hypothetical protein